MDIGEQDWPLGRECKKNSPFNSEPQLLHSASNGILQSEQILHSAIGQSLMLGQRKVSTAEEVNFHDDMFLSLSKASDLELKLPNDGKDVVALLLGSSYPKQDNEREQSWDFEVKKAKGIDRNQFSMCFSGRKR